MIRVLESSKVYVYSPVDVTTGGAELLHQLVHVLNTNNIDAYIVYFDPQRWIVNGEIPKPYLEYFVKTTSVIEDHADNIIVIYEGIFNRVYETKKAQLVLWWLSVDHFYMSSRSFLSIRDGFRWNLKFGLKQTLSRFKNFIFNGKPFFSEISIKKLALLPALHCYQSEYAQNYLLNKGFEELLPLSDFINTDFIDSDSTIVNERSNKILYNPKKGFKYTKKIMENSANLTWVPLIGMTRDELIHEFKTSKLYIDFGYHPGKDRIPREAALGGCCVLTNREGSARFFEDVSINGDYKINTKKENISQVVAKINLILDNFDDLNQDFDFYRSRIIKEKELFEMQIMDIFKQNS